MGNPAAGRIRAIILAMMVFIALAPTLNWMQFTGGSENLVVGTVLEMRRGGPWFIPTLKGAPRTNKPPLVPWVTATSVNSSTVSQLGDPTTREQAYRDLAWEIRWPATLASCALLLVTYELGLVLVNAEVALAAGIIAACSVLFMRFSRFATPDVYLALFVGAANLFFARAIFLGERWRGAFFGGICTGLALMSKGPPALAQILPPMLCVIPLGKFNLRRAIAPGILATVVALAVALPWSIAVIIRYPELPRVWYAEMFQGGTQGGYERDPIYSYLSIFPLMLPFLPALICGIFVCLRKPIELKRVYALLLTFAPILVMSCFKEKNERYLLPMLGPCAVLAAIGLMKRDPLVVASQWAIAIAIAIGLPVASLFLKTVDGSPWLTHRQAAVWGIVLVLIVIVGWMRNRLVTSTFFLIMIAQAVYMWGYAHSSGGTSEMKVLADEIIPHTTPDSLIENYHGKLPIDLEIYLNRVVRPTNDPAHSQARIIVSERARNEPLPSELATWRKIGSTERGKDKDLWEAFERP